MKRYSAFRFLDQQALRRSLAGTALSLLVAGSAPAAADIILLTNGKTLEGTLEEIGQDKVRVRLAYGSLSFSKDQIATVHPARTFEEILGESLQSLSPQDAQGRYQLARQARAEQSLTLYRKLLQEVVAIDPEHEGARRELGYVRHGGEWVTETQLHRLRGDVKFRGQWMAPQARDQILIAEAGRRQAAEERRQAQAEALRQRREAEAAARREAEALAEARPTAYAGGHVALLQPGCNSGVSVGNFGYGGIFGGYSTGPAFQPLQPFQPGLIQVPNQTYRYSVRQNIRVRPGRSPEPYVGYRADPPPQRRRR